MPVRQKTALGRRGMEGRWWRGKNCDYKAFCGPCQRSKKALAIAKRFALDANAKKCKSNSKKTIAFSISLCFFKWHMKNNIRFRWKGFLLKVTEYFKYFVIFNRRNKWRTKIFRNILITTLRKSYLLLYLGYIHVFI